MHVMLWLLLDMCDRKVRDFACAGECHAAFRLASSGINDHLRHSAFLLAFM